MLAYVLSSVACGFASNAYALIVLRVLQALGGCSGMVVTRAVVRDLYDKKRAAIVFSLLVLVMGAAPILAPLLGGYLNLFFGWRSIFFTLAMAGLISSFCVWKFLPETLPAHKRRKSVLSVVADYGDLFRDRNFLGYSLAGAGIRAGMFTYISGSPFVFIELFHVRSDHYGWIFGANAVGLIGSSQLNGLLLKKRFSLEKIL
jgi:DHA1 family bicyclomycin/chloramphenicol resistance-like MFS transporter